MFELFMLFGFGLAAFSQLLPAERKTGRSASEKSRRTMNLARHLRCDPPSTTDRTLRSCSMPSCRCHPADNRFIGYGQKF